MKVRYSVKAPIFVLTSSDHGDRFSPSISTSQEFFFHIALLDTCTLLQHTGPSPDGHHISTISLSLWSKKLGGCRTDRPLGASLHQYHATIWLCLRSASVSLPPRHSLLFPTPSEDQQCHCDGRWHHAPLMQSDLI